MYPQPPEANAALSMIAVIIGFAIIVYAIYKARGDKQ